MAFDFQRHSRLIIFGVACVALLTNVISIAGSNWATIGLYTSGIFLSCVKYKAKICTGEFVYPVGVVYSLFGSWLDTSWFYCVRIFLILSLFLTVAGIVLSFLRDNANYELYSSASYLLAGTLIIIACIIYWNYTAFVVNMIGSDFYAALFSGLAIFACGIPCAATFLRQKFKSYELKEEDEDGVEC